MRFVPPFFVGTWACYRASSTSLRVTVLSESIRGQCQSPNAMDHVRISGKIWVGIACQPGACCRSWWHVAHLTEKLAGHSAIVVFPPARPGPLGQARRSVCSQNRRPGHRSHSEERRRALRKFHPEVRDPVPLGPPSWEPGTPGRTPRGGFAPSGGALFDQTFGFLECPLAIPCPKGRGWWGGVQKN